MNVVLWIAQVLLALAFLGAGATKLSRPEDALEPTMGWTADFSQTAVRLIGAAEVAGALGLVLPAATGVATILTPLAATGLAVIMVGAVVTHARRKEPQLIVVNVVLLAIAALIAWGRLGPYGL